MTISAAMLFSNAASAQFLVGGLPLLVRHIKELHKLGVTELYLLGTAEVPQTILHGGLSDDMSLRAVPCSLEDIPQQLQVLLQAQQDILVLQSTWLIDPRLFAVLLAEPHPQWLPVPGVTAETLPVAARLSPTSLDAWVTGGLTKWLHDDPALQLTTLNAYSPSHHGCVPFYLLAIDTPADAATATKTLITSAQKRALDLPALLLHPWFENRLVFWLCNTRITPNHVTLFTAIPGVVVALLFLNGWLRLGTLLAYAVMILDGVDGKLARTKLQTSRLGELEHVLDFFMEQAWYLTITIFVATSTGKQELWWIGGGLMTCDLLDKSLYGLGRFFLHKHLDELGLFERRFRLIGGRRNTYLWLFTVGFWAGVPTQTCVFVLVWALCTVVVHSSRLVHHIGKRAITA